MGRGKRWVVYCDRCSKAMDEIEEGGVSATDQPIFEIKFRAKVVTNMGIDQLVFLPITSEEGVVFDLKWTDLCRRCVGSMPTQLHRILVDGEQQVKRAQLDKAVVDVEKLPRADK